jgi:hypothetical protein
MLYSTMYYSVGVSYVVFLITYNVVVLQGGDSQQRQENGAKDAKRLRNKQHFASMSNEKRNERNMKKRERRLEKKLHHGGTTSFPGNSVLIR